MNFIIRDTFNKQIYHTQVVTEAMNTKSTRCHGWRTDGVNQICEFADQKNSLQSVNHNLHMAPAVDEYASLAEAEHRVLPSPGQNT